jgi:hypothetical protein
MQSQVRVCDRVCDICGVLLPESSRSDLRFCGDICRKRAARRRKKQGGNDDTIPREITLQVTHVIGTTVRFTPARFDPLGDVKVGDIFKFREVIEE